MKGPRAWTPLEIAFTVSIALHAAILSLRVAAPETFNRVFQDSALEVILVNTRARAPEAENPQALAQTTLAGGGEAKTGRAQSPLPHSAQTQSGDSAEALRRKLAQMQRAQAELLQQVKQALAKAPAAQAAQTPGEQAEWEQRQRQLLKLLAEIEERIQEENQRPRRHYVSPATREVPFALYYDAMRRRIEERGTRYFPEHQGRKLYGELTMVITLQGDGRVLTTEVAQGSGNSELDRRAQAIASAAGPFGAFSPAMRKQADQLVVITRFIFSHDLQLHAQNPAPMGGRP